jgi:hypothetical protein
MAYQLVAHNSGRGDAAATQITLPFAADALTLVDTTFSSPGAWVSAVLTGAVELHMASLKHDQTITATLRLRTSPDTRIGRDLTTRARVRWGSSGLGLSNRSALVVGPRAAGQQSARLAIAPPEGTPTTTFVVVYDGFASNERVSLWYQRPDGGNTALGEARADAQGRIAYTVAARALPAGRSTLVAYGQCSLVSAVGSVSVE